jgi:hypothetical protein
MIDNLALGLSHGLLALAMWRLLRRPDLDSEETAAQRAAKRRSRFGA